MSLSLFFYHFFFSRDIYGLSLKAGTFDIHYDVFSPAYFLTKYQNAKHTKYSTKFKSSNDVAVLLRF